MKIAVPVANNKICMHFGHCEQFYIYDVDVESKKITDVSKLTPPPHEPGLLPRWLNEQKVNVIIAGGMGGSAQRLFRERSIEVFVGAKIEDPKKLIEDYLDNTLALGTNACDH